MTFDKARLSRYSRELAILRNAQKVLDMKKAAVLEERRQYLMECIAKARQVRTPYLYQKKDK